MNDDCDIVVAADPGTPGVYRARVNSRAVFRARMLDRRRFTLVIHGWNTPIAAKRRDYAALLGLIRARDGGVGHSILTVSWPTDLGKASYARVLKTVSPVATALASLLLDTKRPFHRAREIVLIGHSMGCRLSLELAKLLQANDFGPAVSVFMMAAAVPVAHVEKPQGLGGVIDRLALAKVYYSRTDLALRRAIFGVGQHTAGGAEAHWTAVGLYGAPRAVWGRNRHDKTGYGHGRYWTCNTVARHLVEDHRRREIRVLPALE